MSSQAGLRIAVVMPQVAESMTSAVLATWLKRPGDTVKQGEPIAEVETDKTTVELEAPADGVLDDLRVPAGTESVAVGAVLATILQPLEADADAGASASTPAPAASPAAADFDPVPVAADAGAPASRPAPPPATSAARVEATALAARMAAHGGIDLAALVPTGPDGEVTRYDVEQALGLDSALAAAPAAAPRAQTPPHGAPPPIPGDLVADIPHRDEALTGMRRVTAERMTRAKQTAPHFYLSIDCAVGKLLKRFERANAAMAMTAVRDDVRAPVTAFTLNDVFVRAIALALAAVPEANVAWAGVGLRRFSRVDLAFAVDTPAGLITPVVRSADTKDLHAIAADLRDLTNRARDGRLAPDDYAGGTCTVSNLGMFGVTTVTPILNPPQGCIFGIGAIERRPVVRKKKVRRAPVVTVTLAADHRALDGATCASLLRVLRQLLEEPNPVFAPV